jgi:2,3-bisphosphoglycerate-dependent phosphoglycerate mutase
MTTLILARHRESQWNLENRFTGWTDVDLTENRVEEARLDPRYRGLHPDQIPATESLKLTLERVLPYCAEVIAPQVRSGDDVLIAAHGNSLRALCKQLLNISDDEIPGLEIPTGNALVMDLAEDLSVRDCRYLDPSRAAPIPNLGPADAVAAAR